MDEPTLAAYDQAAVAYCDEWLGQPMPTDIYALWRQYLVPGAPGADIGSGSGRDVDWLNRNGYPCIGFDASAALLAESSRRFPHWRFEKAALPALAGIHPESFQNVVCETVLMHLAPDEVGASVRALTGVLRPGGILYLSWRVNESALRDSAGRLYSAFPVADVRAALGVADVCYDSEESSASSGRRVQRLIARKR
jgi:SAM-dependent methyltransferase